MDIATYIGKKLRGVSGGAGDRCIGVLLMCAFSTMGYAKDGDNVDLSQKLREPAHSSPIVLSSNDSLLWSVNPDSDSVTITRTDTNQVVDQIMVGDEPRSIAVTPSGRYAFVANAASNSVTVIEISYQNPEKFSAELDLSAFAKGEIVTGSEPRSIVVTPDGKMVLVANSSQDTITIIDASSHQIIDSFDLRRSRCNVGDMDRHFQPGALAVTADSKTLFVTRFLSFTSAGGVQRDDFGKEAVVCKLKLDSERSTGKPIFAPKPIIMHTQETGFLDVNGDPSYAFPNQLQSIVIRGDKAYLPNIGASPTGPQNFFNNTQAYVNVIGGVGSYESSLGALNLHLGGRDPELGKQELYFANPWAIAFTTSKGEGSAYVVSAGSDLLVKLKVYGDGSIGFTEDEDTTGYIDLNDPDNSATRGWKAGKNPLGIAINRKGDKAYTLNFLSRNVSVVDLHQDQVIDVIQVDDLPEPGTLDERLLVGAEMFFSSRGNFVMPPGGMGANRDRLSEKGRQNCASCHSSGLTDGVVWQFATGPRKTLSVNGTFNPQDVTDQRIINASAIFDEVEDADFNTRFVSSAGLLEFPSPCIESPPIIGITESRIDPDHGLVLGEWDSFEFAPCIMNPFDKPNANRPQPQVQLPGSTVLVNAHDALVDWQRYSVRTPNRPMTENELAAAGLIPVGGLNDSAVQKGERLFKQSGCDTCHNGGKWSRSQKDFVSPPAPTEIASEFGVPNVNQSPYLYRFLFDIGSFGLNVPASQNQLPGYPAIGGAEQDSNGLGALGFDYNGDGKGSGYNVSSILGAFSVPPYYHNGACETLMCVLADEKHRQAGLEEGESDVLSNRANRRRLVEYLESIDEQTVVF